MDWSFLWSNDLADDLVIIQRSHLINVSELIQPCPATPIKQWTKVLFVYYDDILPN